MMLPFVVRIALLWTCLVPCVQAETIRVVTEETSFSYLRQGRVVGPATQVVEATLARAGLDDYRIGLYPWARAYDMALREPNVLIYLIARTPEREGQFHWAGEILRIDYHLYRLPSRKDVQIAQLEDAKQYRIGALRGDVRYRYLQDEGFTKLVVTVSNADSFKLLSNGQVDLVPMSEQGVRMFCTEEGLADGCLERVLTLNTATSLYMAYSLQSGEDVVLRTQAAFESLQADGTVARLMAGQR
ncbi:transporter substrate-binding domain-containing protein [Pseudomonas sp. KSR10]|jgi:polar amino acid transport system substrate-binding protein|uniref:ABC transporter substrate-binding protein n=1 Tax=Stutzerimonas stutzeri TaxID=316 RepID=A0A0D9AVA0_STUST|nr:MULTISPECIES: transporter substrate-binding domain-containing protein [Pseudomonadaceae]KJH84923.1 ABC transporter substrate-binding protein [Stutzerimonas stutzeri]MCG6539299.1 transporter substrate-binding domain-containing protein [Pseudomonas sp. KSR10]